MHYLMNFKKISFSFIYGIQFAIIGLLIGLVVNKLNDSHNNFYIYSSLAGFLTAWLFSIIFIERKKNFDIHRLVGVAILVGIFSHLLCWYLFAIDLNFRYWILNESNLDEPPNLLEYIVYVFGPTFFSLLFFGFVTVFGSIVTILFTRMIKIGID